jgi:hypothetical protein
VIISVSVEKVFNKIQYYFMTETLNKLEVEGNKLKIIKIICEKPKAFSKRLKAFPLRSGTRQRCLLLPFLFPECYRFEPELPNRKKKKKKESQPN